MNGVDESSWWPTGRSRLIFVAFPVGLGLVALAGTVLGTGQPPIVALATTLLVAGIALVVCAAGRGIRRGQSAENVARDRSTTLRQVRGRLPYGPRDVAKMRPVADTYGRSCTDSILFSLGLVGVTAGMLGIADTTFVRAIAGGGLVVVLAATLMTARDLRHVRRFLAETRR